MTRVTGGAFALMVLLAGFPTPAAAQEARPTCAGAPVTIHYQDPGVGTTINGTSGNDVIQGGPEAERINAGGGNDVVCAGGGGDIIDGGPQQDELFGQGGSDEFGGADLGQDLVTGGTREFDVAMYTQLPAGVEVDLSNGLVHMTSGAVNGGILGIEIVSGTAFDDVLVGRSGNESLHGGRGNDVIDGRGGSNHLEGGPNIDTVSYATATEAVSVNLSTGLTTRSQTEDRVFKFEAVVGSPFADRLVGTNERDELVGGGRDDVIKGKDDNDVLRGGGGDDVIHPGRGDDFVDGGTNDPVTSSGAHGDLVSYQGDALPAGVANLDVSLYYFAPTNNPPYASGIGEDQLSGIESVRGVKNGRNHVQGNDGPNVIIGGDGKDFLVGRGGNDLLYGLSDVDILNGDYAAGENPAIFGDDYLDGGTPSGPRDADRVHGNGGDDTCTGAIPDGDNMATCETVF